MACKNCNSTNDKCGCQDTALTTPIASNCVTPCIPGCEEYTNAKCIILTDGINDIGIQPGDTLESIIQRLVLAITNPECIGLPSLDGLQLQVNGVDNIDQNLLDLVEGSGINIVDNGNGSVTISCSTGVYTVSNGLNEDPASNFKLGGYLVEDTTVDGVDTYKINFDNITEFNIVDAGLIDVRSTGDYKQRAGNHSFYNPTGTRLLNVNSALGQMTLDGYYATTGVLYTATPAYVLSVDNLGNVLKSPYNSTVVGSITGDNGITNNTTTNVRLGGDLVQNTIITGGGSAFDLSLGDLGSTDPIGDLNLYAANLNLQTPSVAAGTAVAGTVLKLTNATTGTVEFGQPFTLAPGSGGTFTGGVLNIPVGAGINVLNGLTLAGGIVKLGGNLSNETFLNLGPYKLHFVASTTGTFLVESTVSNAAQFSTTNGVVATFENKSSTNGINNTVQILTTKSSGISGNGLGGQISFTSVKTNGVLGNTSYIRSSWDDAVGGDGKLEIGIAKSSIPSTAFTIAPTGQIRFNKYNGLFTGVPSKYLAVDANGNVIETASTSGLNATNGLNILGSDIKLGGTLIEDTTINTLGYATTLIGSTSVFPILNITNVTGAGLVVSANGTGQGINSTSVSGAAVSAVSTSSIGVIAQGSIAGQFLIEASSTNTVRPIIQLYRNTSGTAANGIGGSIDFSIETNTGGGANASKISTAYTDSTPGSLTADFTVDVINNDVLAEKLKVYGSGQLKLNEYTTSNAFESASGSSVGLLNVDNTGNVFVSSTPLIYAGFIDNISGALTEYSNTTGATITGSGWGSSQITLTASANIFTSKTLVMFQGTSGSQPSTYLAGTTSASTVDVFGYVSGVASWNNIIGYIKIEIYP